MAEAYVVDWEGLVAQAKAMQELLERGAIDDDDAAVRATLPPLRALCAQTDEVLREAVLTAEQREWVVALRDVSQQNLQAACRAVRVAFFFENAVREAEGLAPLGVETLP